jgi:hypothetical protein
MTLAFYAGDRQPHTCWHCFKMETYFECPRELLNILCMKIWPHSPPRKPPLYRSHVLSLVTWDWSRTQFLQHWGWRWQGVPKNHCHSELLREYDSPKRISLCHSFKERKLMVIRHRIVVQSLRVSLMPSFSRYNNNNSSFVTSVRGCCYRP